MISSNQVDKSLLLQQRDKELRHSLYTTILQDQRLIF